MPELFDVVDDQDRVLRQEARADVHRQRLLHRAVHVLVFNPAGDVYLQRRSAAQDTYPLRWTTSCSGHVDAGEDYDTAVLRELGEELGLKSVELGARSLEQETKSPAGKSTLPTSDSPLPAPCSQLSALIPFRKHSPCRETGWEFIWIYLLTTATPPSPDPAEIAEGRWCPAAELDAWMAREPKAFTPSFILVWKLWRE